MFGFIIRRVLWTIPVLLLATLLTFELVQALPGGPFDSDRAARLNPAIKHNLEVKYHLDCGKQTAVQCNLEQYGYWVSRLVRGDLGPSLKSDTQTVNDIIKEYFPVSLRLGVLAFLFSLVVGTAAGVFSALWESRWPDSILTFVSTMFFAVPTFVTATFVVQWFPNAAQWDTIDGKLWPALVLGLSIMPYFTRLVRASMIETLQSEFVTTARSKGLRWRRTVLQHVLRNSLIPVVVNAGPLFGFVITGSFIIENIMSVPGIADQFVTAFQTPQDLNVVLGTTVLLAVIIIMVNLLVDIIIGFLDPRISHD